MTPQVATMVQACKMGILNDVAIRELCTKPSVDSFYKKARESYLAKFGLAEHFTDAESQETTQAVSDIVEEMTSKWHPMISPFEPTQVRTIGYTEEQIKEIFSDEAKKQERNPNFASREAFMLRSGAPGYRSQRVISYGTTSFGYDVTLDEVGFKIFSGLNVTEIDPMEFDDNCLVNAVVRINPKNGLRYILLPPHSYGLGVTREYFFMPRDTVALCIGKSTYARAGVLINATPIEPGFEGNVVIEVANLTPLPARIYLNTGIAQFLFFRGEEECEVSYADRGGKYQGQTGVQLPLI